MRERAFRPIAIMLGLLLVAAVPAQAGPVTLADVIQLISGSPRNGGQAPQVQLRYAQEDKAQKSNPSSTTNASSSSASSPQQGGGDISPDQETPVAATQQTQAQTEEVGEIEVGDCDCGELPDEIVELPGKRNFLPFLPLIGLVCVTGICTNDDNPPPPTPTPTPPNTPVPEPATLLLFGSSLAAFGAGARRRYARAKLAQQANITEG
jgi:PEP-CTERM motif